MRSLSHRLPSFTPQALAAASAGTWQRNPETGLIQCDPIMAGIFGLDAKEAERGIPLSSLQAMIHPSDFASFERVQRDIGPCWREHVSDRCASQI